MKIALVTLTWDRLALTKRSFASLVDRIPKNGPEIVHYVRDQGSTDGTPEWLSERYRTMGKHQVHVISGCENLGIPKGLNQLVRVVASHGGCDLLVKFDNDCEILTGDLFERMAEIHAADPRMAFSPEILGIDGIHARIGAFDLGRHRMEATTLLAGVCLACPWNVFADGFRFSEGGPIYGGEDSELTRHVRERMCRRTAYARDLAVRHLGKGDEWRWYDERRGRAVDEWSRRNCP